MKKTLINIAIGFVLGNLFLAGVIFVWHHHFRGSDAEQVSLDQAVSIISNGDVDNIRIELDYALLSKSDGRIHPESVKIWRCKLEFENDAKKITDAAMNKNIMIKMAPSRGLL